MYSSSDVRGRGRHCFKPFSLHTQICSFPETAFFESIVGLREQIRHANDKSGDCFLRRFHRIFASCLGSLILADQVFVGVLAEIKREDMADLIPYRSRSIRKLAAAGLAILDRIARKRCTDLA